MLHSSKLKVSKERNLEPQWRIKIFTALIKWRPYTKNVLKFAVSVTSVQQYCHNKKKCRTQSDTLLVCLAQSVFFRLFVYPLQTRLWRTESTLSNNQTHTCSWGNGTKLKKFKFTLFDLFNELTVQLSRCYLQMLLGGVCGAGDVIKQHPAPGSVSCERDQCGWHSDVKQKPTTSWSG